MLPERFREQHDRYLDGWMRAEEVLKITERIKNETFIPSVKELRYASRRVVQAHIEVGTGNATDDCIHVHLTEAIENCRKARHDAIDSAINFVHEQLDKVSSTVGLAVLSQAFPRYAELRGRIRAIDARIVLSRRDRGVIDDEYEAIKRDHLNQVVDCYFELESSADVIKDIQRRERRTFWLGVVGVGLFVGLVGGAAVIAAEKHGYFDWAVSSHAQSAKIPTTSTPEKSDTKP